MLKKNSGPLVPIASITIIQKERLLGMTRMHTGLDVIDKIILKW